MASLRTLELFCGLGGCAQALRSDDVQIVGALELAPHVLDVYRLNHPTHPTRQVNLQYIKARDLEAAQADLWWMSPPCQPYTVRGLRRDLEDARAQSLLHLLQLFAQLRPPMLAMENVAGFWDSQARQRLLHTLTDAGYAFHERLLCPTQLGIPAQRERYYLVASRQHQPSPPPLPSIPMTPLSDLLDPVGSLDDEPALWLDPADVARHGPGMRILERPLHPDTRANCFTSAYAKSFRCAGSFLREPDGRVRYFSPRELLGLLGFSPSYHFPSDYTLRQRYKAIGNSLSTFAVREVLRALPPLAQPPRGHLEPAAS